MLGIPGAAQRVVRPLGSFVRPLGILSYHRVAEPVVDPWNLAVAPRTFADQLTTFGEVGRFVELERAARARARRAPGRRPRFALTFDDGYADNLDAAVPMLEAADAPATVFITTGMIDRPSFWWDALDDALLAEARPVDQLIDAGRRVGLLTDAIADRSTIQSTIHASLAERAPLEVEPLVDELLAELGAPTAVPSARPLTTDELVVLASHPLITIGIHTVHHVRMGRAGPEVATKEVLDSAAHLDALLGPRVRPFAYPHGDVDAVAIDIARRAGCSCAVTTDHRWVAAGDDVMALPRLTVIDQPADEAWRGLDAVRTG